MPIRRRYQQGLGLVELMVSLVIGMIVIAGTLTITASTMGANASQMKMSRLNNELRLVMDLIVRDLRRAGFHTWGIDDKDFSTNPRPLVALTSDSSGCQTISISYDENADRVVDAKETFHFRWSANSIQTAVGSATPLVYTDMIDTQVIQVKCETVGGVFTNGFEITDLSYSLLKADTGGELDVKVPIYRIKLTGSLKADPGTSRTIQETVRLRNVVVTK